MPEFTPEELDICVRVLQEIADDPGLIRHHERMKGLIARIHREAKKGIRRENEQRHLAADQQALAATALVRSQQQALPIARLPEVEPSRTDSRSLNRGRNCYICKQRYFQVHFFYHLLCPDCAELNYRKRQQRANLEGRFALVTGGRIKIGFQLALRLLRDGATVLLTTRFPEDARRRFLAEPDCRQWQERLQIHGLDLRYLPAVEAFARSLRDRLPHLDILVNNAAQTVKRPLAFYRHLLEQETAALTGEALVPPGDPLYPFLIETHPDYPDPSEELGVWFPEAAFDADGQQVDRRPENSWRLKLGEVSGLEAVETHLVNAVAPFILCGELRPLLQRSPSPRRFIVNVSAMEGQFGRERKTAHHPHTNMAKAALNMLTRTAAAELATKGIYMNSVDTGWITDEKPLPTREKVREEDGFYTPLDAVDGMARIYDPIARGLTEPQEPLSGHFLKDYAPYPW